MCIRDRCKGHPYSSLRSYYSLCGREGEELYTEYIRFSKGHIEFGREDYSLQGNLPVVDTQFSQEL